MKEQAPIPFRELVEPQSKGENKGVDPGLEEANDSLHLPQIEGTSGVGQFPYRTKDIVEAAGSVLGLGEQTVRGVIREREFQEGVDFLRLQTRSRERIFSPEALAQIWPHLCAKLPGGKRPEDLEAQGWVSCAGLARRLEVPVKRVRYHILRLGEEGGGVEDDILLEARSQRRWLSPRIQELLEEKMERPRKPRVGRRQEKERKPEEVRREFVIEEEFTGLGAYQRWVAETPLLSREEEVALFKILEQEDRGSLAWRTARDRLIKANQRLIFWVALRFTYLGWEDRIQEGNLGLMKAIDKFDWRRGFKLSTYAVWWIRQSIQRAIIEGHDIRLPAYMVDNLHRIWKIEGAFVVSCGRDPTPEEVSIRGFDDWTAQEREKISNAMSPEKGLVDYTKLDEGLARKLEEKAKRIAWIRSLGEERVLALAQPVGGEDNRELGMFVRDPTSLSPEEAILRVETREYALALLALIEDDRMRMVVCRRFGLITGEGETLEAIAQDLGVTRERVRQIVAQGIKRIQRALARREAINFAPSEGR